MNEERNVLRNGLHATVHVEDSVAVEPVEETSILLSFAI